jgi:LacI family transcriptional regulator
VSQTTLPNDPSAKYVGLAAKLASRLRAGEWSSGKVPTVREIASEYAVSSFTASRAMHLLRDQGLVVTRERSGCYVNSADTEPPVSSHWAIVLRVSPGPWRATSESVSRVGFEKLSGEEKFIPYPLDLPATADPKAFELIARTIAAEGSEGVFFLPSRVSELACRQDEAFLAECRRSGLPVVLLDRNLRGLSRPLEFDLIASDHFDGGRCCTEHLLRLPRRAVACVVASPTSAHCDRVAGYLYALEMMSGGQAPRVIWVPEHLDAKEAYPWVANELIRTGADGVICYQDYVAVGVILELFRRGINVPRDVAVVGCDDLPIGNSFALGVTSYSYPSEAIARTALRTMTTRIAHPDEPAKRIVLPGKLVVRDSTVVS